MLRSARRVLFSTCPFIHFSPLSNHLLLRPLHLNSSAMNTSTSSSRLSDSIRDLVSQDFSQLMLDVVNPGHYLLIDIGANLANRKFAKDLDAVLQRARDVGKN